MKIRKTSATRPDESVETRYNRFVSGLEMLSNRYGVVLQVAGGIQFFDQTTQRIVYDQDSSSGDLVPRIGRK